MQYYCQVIKSLYRSTVTTSRSATVACKNNLCFCFIDTCIDVKGAKYCYAKAVTENACTDDAENMKKDCARSCRFCCKFQHYGRSTL